MGLQIDLAIINPSQMRLIIFFPNEDCISNSHVECHHCCITNKTILVYWIDWELGPSMVAHVWCFLAFPATMNQQPPMHHEGWMIIFFSSHAILELEFEPSFCSISFRKKAIVKILMGHWIHLFKFSCGLWVLIYLAKVAVLSKITH